MESTRSSSVPGSVAGTISEASVTIGRPGADVPEQPSARIADRGTVSDAVADAVLDAPPPTVVTEPRTGDETSLASRFRIAAIVPCHNEEAAVATVVRDLQRHVPGITVFVYDNCSTDETVARAREAGAVVRREPHKGKGNVVRRAFADIDADIYLLVDGDDTYDVAAAPRMIATLVEENVDHLVGVRRQQRRPGQASAYRPAHETGNKVLNRLVAAIFGDSLGDMLSGYRVFSRRFVKSFPAVSREFEIETELTVHSLALRIPSMTAPVGFKDRAEGSESKLRTVRDGWKILQVIVNLTRHERPVFFYGVLAALLGLTALGAGAIPVIGSVAQPLLTLLASLSVIGALVLDGMRKSRHESSRLIYLALPSLSPQEPVHHLVERRQNPAA